MIVAGPCLINNTEREIENAYKTAEALAAIDTEIKFRAKIWGGGLTPDIYFPGIEEDGIDLMSNIKTNTGLEIGTELQCESRLQFLGNMDFIWTAARAMQAYGFLEAIGKYKKVFKHIMVKRHFGCTQEETWGIHDICHIRHGYKPFIIERGVSTLDAIGWEKWIPDFRFIANTLRERPDIDLMFDPSHASGNSKNIPVFTDMALVAGVKHFMLEVYCDTKSTQSDEAQVMNIEEFKKIYDKIKAATND